MLNASRFAQKVCLLEGPRPNLRSRRGPPCPRTLDSIQRSLCKRTRYAKLRQIRPPALQNNATPWFFSSVKDWRRNSCIAKFEKGLRIKPDPCRMGNLTNCSIGQVVEQSTRERVVAGSKARALTTSRP